MLRIYIAAPVCDVIYAKEVRHSLLEYAIYSPTDIDFVSSWIDDKNISYESEESANSRERLLNSAMEDLRMIDTCDVFLQLVNKEVFNSGNHVELGYAIAKEKRCIFLGPKANLFHYLPRVTQAENVDSLRRLIRIEIQRKKHGTT